MTVFQFVILGLIQGITEFLPISSSGHLVLLGSLFGLEETLLVSILLHVATLCSVVVVMRGELVHLLKNPFSKEMKKLAISTIVTLCIVLMIYGFAKNSYIEEYLPLFFMVTATMLVATEVLLKNKKTQTEITMRQSLFVGIAQGFAIFPGVSRSGTTICVGMLAGGAREKVTKFSFLLSIPIILASMLMEVIELSKTKEILSFNLSGMILGFVTAFLVGIFALKIMIKATSKIKFGYFAIYLIALSIVLLII